ncbi:MAG: N-acylneuraminate-9-phosphate synthase [Desulfobulbaceae bacterium A2]|nr:MAG: N-acylneuraminate-9-phosphate synthase [Desulfobulbaceae bacterium A2]
MAFSTHIEIAGRRIGPGEPCYVIAEAGVSHFGSMEKADQLIDLAVSAGADAFKTQHFHTDVLVGPCSPDWRERLRSKELPDAAIRAMRDRCRAKGISFLCTAHDEPALGFLADELDVPAFKIGSGEVENWPFLAKVARYGKPVVLSTGMYTLEQIREAITVMADNGCSSLAILHCVTSYPADPSIVNLRVMQRIREFFPGPVGYSDHTAGTAVPLAAVALGANIIEKHITLERDIPNAQDWKVACDPSNLPRFIADIREVEAAQGESNKHLSQDEQRSLLWARKSVTLTRDVPAGSVLEPSMLQAQRPGIGIPPSALARVVGSRLRVSLAAGSPLAWEQIDPALPRG